MPRKQSRQPNSSNPSLALSDLHLRLQSLEAEYQWLLKQIHKKQNELNNFIERMRVLATKVFQQGEPLYQKLMQLDREIHALFDEILTERKLGKKTFKDILEIYQRLQMMGIISPKIDRQPQNQNFNVNFPGKEAEFDDRSQNYASLNNDDDSNYKSPESRQIRHTFLKLAAIFHPDKVMDTETRMHYGEIMKEVNRAYNEGDIARLLEIEREHQLDKSISIDNLATNDLEKQCQRRITDNQLLTTQYENLKQELRSIRNTPEGEMLKEYRACLKEGIDPITTMLSEIETQVEEVTEIRDFVRDFRDKKMTIKRFLQGPEGMKIGNVDEMDFLLEQIFDEMGISVRF
jgi:hypothetical protein